MSNALKIWESSELLSICEIKTGKHDANHASEDGNYSFFTCAAEPLKASTYSFDGELIFLPGNGANVGLVTYFIGKAEAYQRTYVLHDFYIYPKYVFYHLLKNWKKVNEEKQFGSATNYIKMGNFKSYELEIPPLAEQQEIARQLDTLLAQVEHTQTRLQRIPDILKRFRQSVLADAVSGKLTEEWRGSNRIEEWRDSTFGELGNASGGLTKNSKRQSLELKKPYLRVANVYANSLKLDEVLDIGLTETEFKKTKLEKNDLLIVEGNGSLEHIGRAAIWSGEIEECCHQNHLIRWRAKEGTHPKFALFQLLSPQGRKQLVDVAKSTTGLHTLSISKISLLYLPKVDLREQTQIVARVEQLFAYADRIEQQAGAALERVNLLSQSILAKAFRGELTADWRAANPDLISGENSAETLLAKIKAEKKLSKKGSKDS